MAGRPGKPDDEWLRRVFPDLSMPSRNSECANPRPTVCPHECPPCQSVGHSPAIDYTAGIPYMKRFWAVNPVIDYFSAKWSVRSTRQLLVGRFIGRPSGAAGATDQRCLASTDPRHRTLKPWKSPTSPVERLRPQYDISRTRGLSSDPCNPTDRDGSTVRD
jgi:hypothetical protein